MLLHRHSERLIATYVDIGGVWKLRNDVVEDVPHELPGLRTPGVQRPNRKPGRNIPGETLGGSQFRVRPEDSPSVPWHVDLRDNGDEAVGRILHQFGHLSDGVEPTRPVPDGAGGTHLGQRGPRWYFDAPSLVIGEMQVQHVELVNGEHVDDAPHRLGPVEGKNDVKRESGPCIPWPVDDLDHGKGRDPVRRPCSNQLAERG